MEGGGMKASLLPLRGKYYGTLIEIEDEGFKHTISLWHSGSFEPSDRELVGYCTIEQWRNNELIKIKGLDKPLRAKEVFEICDEHFESRETYALALKMVEKLNS